jgi:hypothetical protein
MNTKRLTAVVEELAAGEDVPADAGSAAGLEQPESTVSTAAAAHVARTAFMTNSPVEFF